MTRSARRAAVLLAALACAAPRPAAAQQSAYEELQRFSGVLNYVRANYVDSVTYAPLVRAAIEGMLHSLDPHSVLLAREDDERLAAVARGELGTAGLSLDVVERAATVVAVGPEGPAEKVGISAGDRITAIEGKPCAGLSADAVQALLAGPKGSRVRLALARGPRLEPTVFEVRLKREAYRWPDVSRTAMLDSLTGYVRLSEFGEGAADAVRGSIRELQRRGARRLVLDVRGNPGGLVKEAVQLASLFLPARTLVFRTVGRKAGAGAEFRTEHAGGFSALPLVLLVDGGSASASEALAGALQDHDRALVVGRRSFGKALVQMNFPLESGDAVHLTIARVVTPSGRFIQRDYHGLTPEQYRALAGSVAPDTTTYRTDAGRPVHAGGGIEPDIALPAAPEVPAWWSQAADSGLALAVADSVAATLAPALRERWIADATLWPPAVLDPLLGRARAALSIPARLDPPVAATLARALAGRVATVRWDPSARDALLLRSDPDVTAAVAAFARMAELRRLPGSKN